MRVTGNRLIEIATAATTKSQAQLAGAQEAVSTGKRVDRPSEDPNAWLAAQRAALRQTLANGANLAVENGRDRLLETDATLATIGDALSQARALAVQGASDTYDATSRAQLAVSVRSLFANVLAAANTRSADGEYLLAGSSSMTAPFDPTTGAYLGDALERYVPTLESGSAKASISGAELTAANGVDVLPLLDQVATALAANNLPGIQAGLADLDTAIKQVSLARTRTGSAQSVLDATVDAHGLLVENLQETISRHVEIDGVAAGERAARAGQAFEASRAVSEYVVRVIGARSS